MQFCYCCLRWHGAVEHTATRLSGCPVKRLRPAQKTWLYLQDATPPAWTRFAFVMPSLWCTKMFYFDCMCVCVRVLYCMCIWIGMTSMPCTINLVYLREFFLSFCTHTFTHLDYPWFILSESKQFYAKRIAVSPLSCVRVLLYLSGQENSANCLHEVKQTPWDVK